ncbi:MAG TPA: nucleotidyltransferase family protein [Nocardioidaceae bacterium]|nr:nucleotidyltransferase family protein [Nocardioidaceae bacterium]
MRDRAVGLLLAAGAGRRMGRPKALVRDADGTSWLLRSIDVLRVGGCADVTVVLGAEAAAARELLGDASVTVVEAVDWAEGMGASLRAGLTSLAGSDAMAACVHLVDLPDVGSDAVARVLTAAAPDALARATYTGRPGHPVLLGRDHWAAAAATVGGDRGARTYLDGHGVRDIDCTDLATGRDVDRRP